MSKFNCKKRKKTGSEPADVILIIPEKSMQHFSSGMVLDNFPSNYFLNRKSYLVCDNVVSSSLTLFFKFTVAWLNYN